MVLKFRLLLATAKKNVNIDTTINNVELATTLAVNKLEICSFVPSLFRKPLYT